MDPALIVFPIFFAIAAISAALSHTVIRNFFWATAVATVFGALVAYGVYGMWRGYVPDALIFASMLGPRLAVALGVGIPFYRRRTGRALGS